MKRTLLAAVGVLVVAFAGCSGRGGERGGTSTVRPAEATATVQPPTPTAVPTIERSESGKELKVRWRWDSGLFNVIIWVRANGAKVAASYGGLHDGPGNFSPKPGGVAVLDAASGQQLWRHETPTQAFPAGFAGGVVAAGTGDGTVFAWDEVTGAERWRLSFDGIPFQVIHAAGVLVVADADPETWGPNGLVDKTRLDGRVWGVDPGSGAVMWKTTVGSFNALLANDRWTVVASARTPRGDGWTVGLEAQSGREIWRQPLESSSPPVTGDGAVFLPGANITAVDLETGALLWTAAAPSGGTAYFPGTVEGAVYASWNTGTMAAFDRHDGHLVTQTGIPECGGGPAFIFRAQTYGLFCFGLIRLVLENDELRWVVVLLPQGAIDSADAGADGIVVSTGTGFSPESVLFIEP